MGAAALTPAPRRHPGRHRRPRVGRATLELIMIVDTAAAMRFLRTAHEPDDWIALFLKSYETGRTAQRVGPLSLFLEPRIHAWVRAMNAQRFNVYVSVNAVRPGVRARTKDAIGIVRHLFLDADHDGAAVLTELAACDDIPSPSYVLESSPNRVHVFWRVAGFTTETIELLQKHLATRFRTDPAATACSQTTRLPGYRNHKYDPAHLVTIAYRDRCTAYPPHDFPSPPERANAVLAHPQGRRSATRNAALERARRYLARVDPAIAGQHGDLHTFRVCCRIVRGFELEDADALAVLHEWNKRCSPPWSERDLGDKIARARRYGREPVGGML